VLISNKLAYIYLSSNLFFCIFMKSEYKENCKHPFERHVKESCVIHVEWIEDLSSLNYHIVNPACSFVYYADFSREIPVHVIWNLTDTNVQVADCLLVSFCHWSSHGHNTALSTQWTTCDLICFRALTGWKMDNPLFPNVKVYLCVILELISL